MSHPPRPAGDPLVGHTLRFARRPFDFVGEALDAGGGTTTLDVVSQPPTVVTARPEDAVAVLDDAETFGKTADFATAFGDSIVAAEGDAWRRQRDILDPFFRPSRVRAYADDMVRCARERAARWTPGETIDLETEAKALTLDVLFATLFGRELDPETDAGLYEAASGLNAWFRSTSWVLPEWVPTPSRREFRRARATLRGEIARLVAEHDRGDATGDDGVLGRVLDARDDDVLPDDVVTDLMVGLVFAGHETTALTLAFAWQAMGTRPSIARAFRDEVDALDGDPDYADVPELDVTDRLVAETLRCYPPAHSIPRVARRRATLGEHTVEAGTQVLVSVYWLHRRTDTYDDPGTFDPSRWAAVPVAERDPGTYLPFGRGMRACLGRRFARLEAALVLATVGRRYRLDPVRDGVALDPQMTLQPADGVPVRVRER